MGIPLLQHSVVVRLLERTYLSQMLVMNKHSGDDDLCGSGQQSITPYVHVRFYVVLLSRV
jgi:hypothetical protein